MVSWCIGFAGRKILGAKIWSARFPRRGETSRATWAASSWPGTGPAQTSATASSWLLSRGCSTGTTVAGIVCRAGGSLNSAVAQGGAGEGEERRDQRRAPIAAARREVAISYFHVQILIKKARIHRVVNPNYFSLRGGKSSSKILKVANPQPHV